jgi:hypothetical protein
VSEWYVIRHERPYADEESFIEAEGWALTTKSIVLVDHPDLNVDTPVRCYVTLASGVTLVKAEGIVIGPRAATGDRPAGLEVRFKRIGADTQRLIKRCAERHRKKPPPAPSSRARKQQYSVLDLELEASSEPPGDRASIPDLEPERISVPEPQRLSTPEPAAAPTPVPAAAPTPVPAAAPTPPPPAAPTPPPPRPAVEARDRGGLESLRARPLANVAAPDNRAELLERLRQRSSR